MGANYLLGTVDTGVVIEYKGSQFVWVPVPVTATNSLYPKGTTKAMAKVSTAEGFAGTDGNGRTNYEGVLYNFGSMSGTLSNPTYTVVGEPQVMNNYGQGTTSSREPDILDNEYDNDTNLGAIGLARGTFKTEIQENYNAMIESVKKYGGFYVGRYETSIDNMTTVASKEGTPMNALTDNQRWYGMYDKEKKFTTSSDVMQSSMIWGSQYDAMLNWMVSTGKNVGTEDSSKYNTELTTGSKPEDIINNVYDLYGCHYEWTLEAKATGTRVLRGGMLFPTVVAPSLRDNDVPTNGSTEISSRLSLYIK